jgi:tripartite-type tricarboxylate transporter receptor subunit TctC
MSHRCNEPSPARRPALRPALLLTLAAAALACIGTGARADYPTRPIRMVVGFAPGGATDLYARVVAQRLGERLGQQVVVDNRPGAGGSIGTSLVAKAAPDGHTLLFASPSHAINVSLYRSLPYDPLRDFVPIAKITNGSTYVLVAHPSLPVQNLKDFIAYAKAKPGTINFASAGSGSTSHLAGELFKSRAGIDIVHVPYKGTGDAIRDLLTGQVQATVDALPALLPHIKRGALKALGVNIRTTLLPEVPLIADAGVPQFEFYTWIGVLAPAATPAAIVRRLNGEINSVLRMPEVEARFAEMSSRPVTSTPEDFRRQIEKDIPKFAAIIKAAGIQPQ